MTRTQSGIPLERTITKSILEFLNGLPECYAMKTKGDYRSSGQPDIIGCHKGRALALEVKRPEVGRITALQAVTLGKWRAAGAIAEIVHSVEETAQALGVQQ